MHGAPDLPVRYSAMKLDDSGRMSLGRGQAVADLQHRLLNAQQSMERDYSRWRRRRRATPSCSNSPRKRF